MSSEVLTCTVPAFRFIDGSVLNAKVAYLDINPTASKTALIITCFRGRLPGTLNFSDGALKDHRVVVAALFSNGESSSPSNEAEFPDTIDYRDCVEAQKYLLTTHLGIKSLDVVLGFSMGGQCTYHWTLMYPDFVKNAVMICSSAKTSRHNYQFLEGPKAALQNAIDYTSRPEIAKGASAKRPDRGLHAFGKAYSAWLPSAEWFEQEKYKTLGFGTLADWDRATTVDGYRDWDAEDLLCKLGMWQRGDISVLTKEGTLEAALSQIKARVLLMPCETDQYFRPSASEKECKFIPDAKVHVIPSVWGHLAGAGPSKEDNAWMDHEIAEFFAS